jgi:hypothetical protein
VTPDGLTAAELRAYRDRGWKCVRFVTVRSYGIATVEDLSRVYLTETWQDRYLRGLWYSVLALAFGPWGVPYGLWRTAEAVWTNLTGGLDVTDETLDAAKP